MTDSFPTISADQLTKAAAGVLSPLDEDNPEDDWQKNDVSKNDQSLQSSLELLENLSTTITSDLVKLNNLHSEKLIKNGLPFINVTHGKVKKYDGSTKSGSKKYSSRKNYKLLPPLCATQPLSLRKHVPAVSCQKQVVTLSHQPNVLPPEVLKTMPVRLARYTTNYLFIRAANPVQTTLPVDIPTLNFSKIYDNKNSLKSCETASSTSSGSLTAPVAVNTKSLNLIPIAPKLLQNKPNIATVVISGACIPTAQPLKSSLRIHNAVNCSSSLINASNQNIETCKSNSNENTKEILTPADLNSSHPRSSTSSEIKVGGTPKEELLLFTNITPPPVTLPINNNELTFSMNCEAKSLNESVKLASSEHLPLLANDLTSVNVSKYSAQHSSLRILLQKKPTLLPQEPTLQTLEHTLSFTKPCSDSKPSEHSSKPGQIVKVSGTENDIAQSHSRQLTLSSKNQTHLGNQASQSISVKPIQNSLGSETCEKSVCSRKGRVFTSNKGILAGLLCRGSNSTSHSLSFRSPAALKTDQRIDHSSGLISYDQQAGNKSTINNSYPALPSSNQTLLTSSHLTGSQKCAHGLHLQQSTYLPLKPENSPTLATKITCQQTEVCKDNSVKVPEMFRNQAENSHEVSVISTKLLNTSLSKESLPLSTVAAAAAMVSLSEIDTTVTKVTKSAPCLTDTSSPFVIPSEHKTKLVISPAGIRHLQSLLRKKGISEGYFVIASPRISGAPTNTHDNVFDSHIKNSLFKRELGQAENTKFTSPNHNNLCSDPTASSTKLSGKVICERGGNVEYNVNTSQKSPAVDVYSQDSYESDSSSESLSSSGALIIETGEDEDRQSSTTSADASQFTVDKQMIDTDKMFHSSPLENGAEEKSPKHLEESTWDTPHDASDNGCIAQSPLSLSDLIRHQQRHGDFHYLTPENKSKSREGLKIYSENMQEVSSAGNGDDFNFTMPLCPASAYCSSNQPSAIEMSPGFQHSIYASSCHMFSKEITFEANSQPSSVEAQSHQNFSSNGSPKLLSRPTSAISPKSPLLANSTQNPDHNSSLNPPMTPNTMLINLLNRVPTPLLTNHQDLLSIPTSQENNMHDSVAALRHFEIMHSKEDNIIFTGQTMSYTNTSDQNASHLASVQPTNTNFMYQDSGSSGSRKFGHDDLVLLKQTYSTESASSEENRNPIQNFNEPAFTQNSRENQTTSMHFSETYADNTQGRGCQNFHCKSCPGSLVVTVNLDVSSAEYNDNSPTLNEEKSLNGMSSTFRNPLEVSSPNSLPKANGSSEAASLNLVPVKSSDTDILRHLILNTSSATFHAAPSGDGQFITTPSNYDLNHSHVSQPLYTCQVQTYLHSESQHKALSQGATYPPHDHNFQPSDTFKSLKHIYKTNDYGSSESYNDSANRSFVGVETPTMVHPTSPSYILQPDVPPFSLNNVNKNDSIPMEQPFLGSTERLQHLTDFQSDDHHEALFYQHPHDQQANSLHQPPDLHLYNQGQQHQDLSYHHLAEPHETHQYSAPMAHPSTSRIFDDHPEGVGFIGGQFSPQYYDNSRMSVTMPMFSQQCAVASEAPVLGTNTSHSCNIPFSSAPTGLQLEFHFPPDDEDDESHNEKQPVLPSASFSPPSVADPAVTPEPGGIYNGTFPNISVYDMYVREGNSDGRCGENDSCQELGHFCVDCNMMYTNQCKFHPREYSYICDTPILSHARLTLPSCLRLGTSNIIGHTNNTGVFAKEAIGIRTKFGPLLGSSVSCDQLGFTRSFSLWQTLIENGTKVVDTSDENSSNWMMFVKPARLSSEQNIVAFQHGSNVYFVTRVDIRPGQELLYWFAKDYARLLGIPPNPKSAYHQLCPHCSVCKQIFPDRKQLRSHTKLEHPRPCTKKCSHCSRKFSQVSHLKAHIAAVHLKMKKCACPHCDKRFSDSSNLRKHVRSHSEERCFKCQICGKDFRQKAHLTHHMNTHIPVKNEQCGFCGVRFTRAFTRKQHELQHTKQNKISCIHCNKVFFKQQVYKQHLKIHSNERNYVCHLCNKAFRTKANLTRHGPACKRKKNILPLHTMSSQSSLSTSIPPTVNFLNSDDGSGQFIGSPEIMPGGI